MKIFITGGTTGIGLALARYYVDKGHEVAVCGRDLTKLSEEDQNKFSCYRVDVKDEAEMRDAIDDFSRQGLDLLIASAGRSVGVKRKDLPLSEAKDVIETNVFGVLNAFDAAFSVMREKGGHLVAIASVSGMVGLPGAASYSASKAAIIKYCESLNLDYKSYGIDVTCVCPGFVKTPLTDLNDHPMPFCIEADEAAKIIANGIEKKKELIFFPLVMRIVMTVLEICPRFMYRYFMGFKRFNYSKR